MNDSVMIEGCELASRYLEKTGLFADVRLFNDPQNNKYTFVAVPVVIFKDMLRDNEEPEKFCYSVCMDDMATIAENPKKALQLGFELTNLILIEYVKGSREPLYENKINKTKENGQ